MFLSEKEILDHNIEGSQLFTPQLSKSNQNINKELTPRSGIGSNNRGSNNQDKREPGEK